ncbi:MAG: class I poly(R)-hydroxyalkanoic acid synthase [Marinobacter sp.]|nr:class I poly(R)-hydroxyalkanoic acid synthase [Marinobacter sp.]
MWGLDTINTWRQNLVEGLGRNTQQAEKHWETVLADLGLADDATLATLTEMAEAYRAMLEDAWLHPVRLINTELELARNYLALGYYTLARSLGKEKSPVIDPESDDRRFLADDWRKYLPFDVLQQAYLINSKTFLDWVESVEGLPSASRDQMLFYARQLTSALSPSNYLLTNPEALRITWQRKGRNLLEGAKQLWEDVKANPSLFNVGMTDRSAFEVGKNLATTPGKVVFQNDMMQLIQYSPTTATVYQRPLLIVPPWINKFYILDLTAKNSFIRWLVDQGMTVFVISWVNPGPDLKNKGFDDYLTSGVLAAIETVQKITGESTMNAIGYCIGGTLLGATLAWLAKKQQQPIASATYLTTLLDFSDPGGIGVFINPHTLDGICRMMDKKGVLDGRAMAFTFNLLRENDLFWSFWVNNYLKGDKPQAFDLLYWNTDSTNLPASMHSYYLREMYLHNRLRQPDALTLAGESINLAEVDVPSYFLSARQDHIAKWKATYQGAQALGGQRQFVLSGSGHIAGVINPPSKEKYGFWTHDGMPEHPDNWLEAASQHPGSWWPHWLNWIAAYAGEQVGARPPGSAELPPIEDAPGSYVKVRAGDAIKRGKQRLQQTN